MEKIVKFMTLKSDLNAFLLFSFLCLELVCKPFKDKSRFVLVCDGTERFILMCSHVDFSAHDIIKAHSYRFKIKVNFKVLKYLMGVFFCNSGLLSFQKHAHLTSEPPPVEREVSGIPLKGAEIRKCEYKFEINAVDSVPTLPPL